MADVERRPENIPRCALCFIMETRKRVSRSCSSLSPRRAVANRLRFTVELVYVARRNLETNQPEQKRNREC